jgi:hypothetical protein
MKSETLKSKKRHGDTTRITEIANAKRAQAGKKPYAESTVRAMLNGTRTMKPEVSEAANEFYKAQEDLLTTNTDANED